MGRRQRATVDFEEAGQPPMGTDAVEHACTQSKNGVVHTVQRASGAPSASDHSRAWCTSTSTWRAARRTVAVLKGCSPMRERRSASSRPSASSGCSAYAGRKESEYDCHTDDEPLAHRRKAARRALRLVSQSSSAERSAGESVSPAVEPPGSPCAACRTLGNVSRAASRRVPGGMRGPIGRYICGIRCGSFRLSCLRVEAKDFGCAKLRLEPCEAWFMF